MSGVQTREDKPIEHNQPGSKCKPSTEQMSLTESCHPPHCSVPLPTCQEALQGAVWFYVPSSVHIKLHREYGCVGLVALNHMTHCWLNLCPPSPYLSPQPPPPSMRQSLIDEQEPSSQAIFPFVSLISLPFPPASALPRCMLAGEPEKMSHQSLIIAWLRALWLRCRETVKGECTAEELRAGRLMFAKWPKKMEKDSQVCMSEPSMSRASMSRRPCSIYTPKCLAKKLWNEKKGQRAT